MFDYSAFARSKAFQEDKLKEWSEDEKAVKNKPEQAVEEFQDKSALRKSRMSRPESMVIPIGGVWRPDEDQPVSLFEEQNAEEQSS